MTSSKNNIEITGELTLTTAYARLDLALIRVMLATIVPIGFSYVCDEELEKGMIRFNKNVPAGISKSVFEQAAREALQAHAKVDRFQIIRSELCPIRMVEMSYHCPVPFIDKNTTLD